MKEFLQGAVAVAAGVLMAAAILYGVAQMLAPAQSIAFDMTKYDCDVSGSMVSCELK